MINPSSSKSRQRKFASAALSSSRDSRPSPSVSNSENSAGPAPWLASRCRTVNGGAVCSNCASTSSSVNVRGLLIAIAPAGFFGRSGSIGQSRPREDGEQAIGLLGGNVTAFGRVEAIEAGLDRAAPNFAKRHAVGGDVQANHQRMRWTQDQQILNIAGIGRARRHRRACRTNRLNRQKER